MDLFDTPNNGYSRQTISPPIPPGFFGPGSDSFEGDVVLRGLPLGTTPPGILYSTDTIVRRKADASLPDCTTPVTVPIEIVALSLVSVAPITITYNGGQSPELWNVIINLSSMFPQQEGTAVIQHDHKDGGTFTSTLYVVPRLSFVRVSDHLQRVIDPAPMVTFSTTTRHPSYWLHQAPAPFSVVTSPGGITVDHDGIPATPEVPVGASSNFVAGMRVVGATCVSAGNGPGKTLTEEEALLAKHGVLPPQRSTPPESEGAACLSDCSALLTTPTIASAFGARYRGNGTLPKGDLNGNGCDDQCESVPAASGLGTAAVLLLMLGLGFGVLLQRGRPPAPTA